MKQLGGGVLFLDRNDINTDEIIPARYLTEDTKKALAPFCLEDLALPGFDHARDVKGKGVIVSRANFGCGSSREHAPWAFEMNGINVVVAESFARIFRRNMFNCGMVALELPSATIAELFDTFAATGARLDFDLEKGIAKFSNGREKVVATFALGEFERAMVEAGGWVAYAAGKY